MVQYFTYMYVIFTGPLYPPHGPLGIYGSDRVVLSNLVAIRDIWPIKMWRQTFLKNWIFMEKDVMYKQILSMFV